MNSFLVEYETGGKDLADSWTIDDFGVSRMTEGDYSPGINAGASTG